MASAQNSNHMRSNYSVRTYIHNPTTATDAQVVAWVPFTIFSHFMAVVSFVSGTGVLTFRIMAAKDANGTGAVEVKTHAAPTAADAEDDQLVLECAAEELPALGAGLDYIGVEMDMDHADDICAVTYVRKAGRFAYAGLTGDQVIDGTES